MFAEISEYNGREGPDAMLRAARHTDSLFFRAGTLRRRRSARHPLLQAAALANTAQLYGKKDGGRSGTLKCSPIIRAWSPRWCASPPAAMLSAIQPRGHRPTDAKEANKRHRPPAGVVGGKQEDFGFAALRSVSTTGITLRALAVTDVRWATPSCGSCGRPKGEVPPVKAPRLGSRTARPDRSHATPLTSPRAPYRLRNKMRSPCVLFG